MSTDATDIPDAAETAPPCPRCRHDLRVMMETGRRRCPECGLRFSRRDLYVLRHPPDPRGALRRANPAERRLGGPMMVVVFLMLGAAVIGFSVWVALMLRARA